MALAVCLLLDQRAERRVVALWRALEERGVPTLLTHTHGHHVPHLSYAVLRQFQVGPVREALRSLPAGPPVTLSFDAVAWFRRGRAALVPGVAGDLLARQQRVVEAVTATGAELHHHYEPGAWIPHCSLATRARRAQLADVAGAAYDVLPLTATAEALALVDSGTGKRWPVSHLV